MTHKYIGTKVITAWSAARDGEAGYAVKYADGYTSWSPKVVFEEAYRCCEGDSQAMTFGDAIYMLKEGKKVARAGWNGKGMWLVLVPGTQSVNFTEGSAYMKAGLTHGEILPHIDMYTTNADGRRAMLPGWLASQTDMLATDWQVV